MHNKGMYGRPAAGNAQTIIPQVILLVGGGHEGNYMFGGGIGCIGGG